VSQHISRKDLKTDEIRETLAHGAEAVMSHQRLLGIILGAAVIVGVAIFGWRIYSERQTLKASAAFEGAMKIFEARIRAAGEPAESGELTYIGEKNKYEDAAKKLSEVARNYPRTNPGRLARYYAALSQERLGRYDEAQKALTELERSSDVELAALARLQLAGVYQKTGRTDDATKLYRQLVDKPTTLVPKPLVLLTLADHLRKTNPPEAVKLYNQIRKDFPDTSIADEAEKRLELLGPVT